MVNSLVDIKGTGSSAAFFGKSTESVAFDAVFGITKSLSKESFNILDPINNTSRDFFIDVGAGHYKNYLKDVMGVK